MNTMKHLDFTATNTPNGVTYHLTDSLLPFGERILAVFLTAADAMKGYEKYKAAADYLVLHVAENAAKCRGILNYYDEIIFFCPNGVEGDKAYDILFKSEPDRAIKIGRIKQ